MTAFTDISIATSHHTRVIEQLRQIVITALLGDQVPIQSLRDIVDLMHKNETSFLHFRNSNTYKNSSSLQCSRTKREQMATGSESIKL